MADDESSPPFRKVLTVRGVGEYPRKGDFVTVHCTGYGKGRDLSRKFWSTRDEGEEQFKFQLGGGDVIEGWELALLTMRVGERAEYLIRSDYAYGREGFSDFGIEPDSPLKFDLELLRVDATSGGGGGGGATNRFEPSVPLHSYAPQQLVAGQVGVRYNEKPPAIGLEYTLASLGGFSKRNGAGADTERQQQHHNNEDTAETASSQRGGDLGNSADPTTSQEKHVVIVPLPVKKGDDAALVVDGLLRGDFGCASYFAAVKREQLQRVITVLLAKLS